MLTVFGGARALWCETIAARLREHLPAVYADITQEAVASQLRGLDIDVENVREPGSGPLKGCDRARRPGRRGGPGGRRCVALPPAPVAVPLHAPACANIQQAATWPAGRYTLTWDVTA